MSVFVMKFFPGWRPVLRRIPILTLKPTGKAIMQTFLLLLNTTEPSPRALMIAAAINLAFLTIFLRHKLG